MIMGNTNDTFGGVGWSPKKPIVKLSTHSEI